MLTKEHARELTIEMWTWLRDHIGKSKLDAFNAGVALECQSMRCNCAFCELFMFNEDETKSCKGCPLSAANKGCLGPLSDYSPHGIWFNYVYRFPYNYNAAQEAADTIVKIATEWDCGD